MKGLPEAERAELERLEQGLPFLKSGWLAERRGESVETLPRCDRYADGCFGDPPVGVLVLLDPWQEGGASAKPEDHWWVCSNGHTWRRAEPAVPDYAENCVPAEVRQDTDLGLELQDAHEALWGGC